MRLEEATRVASACKDLAVKHAALEFTSLNLGGIPRVNHEEVCTWEKVRADSEGANSEVFKYAILFAVRNLHISRAFSLSTAIPSVQTCMG